MAKIVYLDVETTGLWENKHAVHQLSGIVEINGQIVDTFDLQMAPFQGALVDDKALAVCGVSLNQINAYPPAASQFTKWISILDKHLDKTNPKDKYFFAAYNSPFDEGFMRAMCKRHGNFKFYSQYFYNPSIDIMRVAGLALMDRIPHMENFKLGTVLRELNIEVAGNLHDAMTDITGARQIFKQCTE